MQFAERFKQLTEASIDEQAGFFSRRFVFTLGDKFGDVVALSKEFKAAAEAAEPGSVTLDPSGAAAFLQSHGKTRTALQRKAEIQDIDIDNDQKISFIEYLLLHYKVMVLTEHFGRLDIEPTVDLSQDGVGLTGVGEMLVEEMYQPPRGVDPALERMMKEFSLEHSKREEQIKTLQAKVDAGGVKGLAAKNELEQLKFQDVSSMNALEAQIANSIKRAQKKTEKEVEDKNKAIEEEDKQKQEDGRAKMAEKMAMFNK